MRDLEAMGENVRHAQASISLTIIALLVSRAVGVL
jgi:hypothetical protein